MPTGASYQFGFWEADPRRWERCKILAAQQMIESGWSKFAGKFREVQMRKARKIWARGE